MSARFVHLRLHSEYSLTDSTLRIDELVRACGKRGMPALALTDDSNLFALLKFFKECEARGIQPIAGADVWVQDGEEPSRLTLLCADRSGYRNLCVLLSRAYAQGRQLDRAVIQRDWLEGRTGGLVALSGGLDGEIGRLLLAGREDTAQLQLRRWMRLFPDAFYLELSRCGRPQEDTLTLASAHLAARAGCPAVATNDVRFLDREDFDAHEARVAIAQGYTLADNRRPRLYSPEQYLKSPAEMAILFADMPEALDNSVDLARRLNLTLQTGTYFLPEVPTRAGEDAGERLAREAREGLAVRLAKLESARALAKPRESYHERLELEARVIAQMGFPGYFLIVADFIGWAKRNGIPVGPGRGSGAGSLVAYALGITDLDPLRYDLLFERFLNPERVSMPDFDIDFCMERRDEVIRYVREAYGADKVAQIITYGSMAAKACVRDCGRVLGLPFPAVDSIAKLIPARPLDLTLEDALGLSEKSKKEPDRISSELRARYEDEDDEARPVLELALSLEGLARNAGKHAGGVVIAPSALTDFTALYYEAKADTGNDLPVTQFDKDDVETIGLVKFDFLGLRTLTIIQWCVQAINARRAADGQPALDIDLIPLDDAPSYQLFAKGDTVAVFQFESAGMQRLLKDARPDRFEDLIALVSLYRPGPMELIPSFCARKHGREPIAYPDPRVEPILKETYGIMVYQEQVMQMAQIVGGYSLGGADLLRRAMGKKKPEEMVKHRGIFREGAAKDGVDEAKADAIFDLMEKFAGYGFNKSHAAAYALVAYQTAWLKAHYPAEFMAATLSSDMDRTEAVVEFLADARARGVAVLPACVNASEYPFRATDARTIRYGLGAIKGVGLPAAEAIVRERARGGAYRDLYDFCQRVDLSKMNRRVLEALIAAGALDALGANRASLLAALPDALKAAEQRSRDGAAGQVDLFGSASASVAPPPAMPRLPEMTLIDKLKGEFATLGWYVSGHPVDAAAPWLREIVSCPLGEVAPKVPPGRKGRGAELNLTVAGMVGPMRKRGDNIAFVQLQDASGRLETAFFTEAYAEFGGLIRAGEIIVVEGSASWDDFNNAAQLRVRRAWPLVDACQHHARGLQLEVHDPADDFAGDLKRALAPWRGGATPLRLRYRRGPASVELEFPESWRLKADPALPELLLRIPGVKSAQWVFGRRMVESEAA
ncbi:MAG: DNA polymerase III subunit alpha [Xanthomonadales bacterium]|nr:DNA polymerase III subunit alpha [Xanthomonadales bacterium]MCC6592629.1 DNA polymerase III subunit alpha [Xanthomonadales bacterium]MCE7932902.1 DNA polymerase III subunit alpha [Xanthomonadales bacterium PRO6]